MYSADAITYSDCFDTPPPLETQPAKLIGYQFPPPNFVGPGDLARSPSPRCIGRLSGSGECGELDR